MPGLTRAVANATSVRISRQTWDCDACDAAATWDPSTKELSFWVGACPGDDESAGVNYSHRCPQGNRHMRRVLDQCANAAVKAKGTIFDIVYRRTVPRLGHNQAIGAIARRQCRADLVDPASGSPLRRTGPSRHQTIEAKTHRENDPAIAKPRLSDRTTESSTPQSSTSPVIFDPGPPPFTAHPSTRPIRWELKNSL